MHPQLVRDKDLVKFTRKFSILIGLTLLAHFIDLAPIAYTLSVIAQLSIFGFHFISFKEFRSAFLNLVLSGLALCLIGEIVLLVDPPKKKYTTSFWIFIGIHFLRNLIFMSAFTWNVVKSIFKNHIVYKIIISVVGAIIFLLLQFFHFDSEKADYKTFFFVFNVVVSLMIYTAGLRNSHTSPEAFLMMFVGSLLFMLSDVCFLENFDQPDNFTAGLRTGLLMVASILVLSAAIHHVLYFKLKVQQIVMAGVTGREMDPMKNRKMKVESVDQTLEENLI